MIPNAELRIVGEGEERNNLSALIAKLGVAQRVTLLGDLQDELVWEQFNWCDLHILPSCERTEAFGLVILEAHCFGKPTVFANIEGSGMRYAADLTGTAESFIPKSGTDLVRAINDVAVARPAT